MPVFSLIVPTLNRTDQVGSLFKSLAEQTFKDFEIIVVDQNIDDRILPIVKVYSSLLDITHVKQLAKGASAARNRGLREVKGEIISFPDDDCEYPAELLESVYNLFEERQGIHGITGSSHDKYERSSSIARFESNETPITKLNIYKCCIEFAIFVRSNVVKDFYFDEELGVGAKTPWWSDEGPDFILRLMLKGYSFIFVPSIIIYHPNPVKVYDEKSFVRSYKYGCGRGRYLRKHNYPLWFVFYVWGLYLAGIVIGIVQLNPGKAKYYLLGLKGRISGYLKIRQ